MKDPATIKAIVDYASQHTYKETGEKFKISPELVYYYYKKRKGKTHRKASSPVTAFVAEYLKSHSISETSKEFGISRQSLYAYCRHKQAPFKRDKPKGLEEALVKEIIALSERVGVKVAASHYGIKPPTLLQWRKKYGLGRIGEKFTFYASKRHKILRYYLAHDLKKTCEHFDLDEKVVKELILKKGENNE